MCNERVRTINVEDYLFWLQFCDGFSNRAPNHSFISVFYMVDTKFVRDSIMNTHKEHHCYGRTSTSANVSCNEMNGIVGNHLLEPNFYQKNYPFFKKQELGDLLDDIPIDIQCNLSFMHCGAPSQFSFVFRQYLGTFPNEWIGRGGYCVACTATSFPTVKFF